MYWMISTVLLVGASVVLWMTDATALYSDTGIRTPPTRTRCGTRTPSSPSLLWHSTAIGSHQATTLHPRVAMLFSHSLPTCSSSRFTVDTDEIDLTALFIGKSARQALILTRSPHNDTRSLINGLLSAIQSHCHWTHHSHLTIKSITAMMSAIMMTTPRLSRPLQMHRLTDTSTMKALRQLIHLPHHTCRGKIQR